VSSRINV
jgi:hypothetical protein